MTERRWFVPVALLAVVALLVAAMPVRERLLAERRRSGLGEVEFTGMPTVGAVGLLLMGGFRGVAVDILWLRVNALHQERRYEEEISLIELITHLQPYYTSVWIFQGWNIAYNISVQSTDPEIQWQRIQYGINFVKRGLRLNPNDVDLLFYLAHLHREKVAQRPEYESFMERDTGVNNFEEAARYYRLARETGGELQTFHPRVVDSGVWHSYYQRILQILRRAELDDSLDFPPDVLLRVRHFLDLCHKESRHLIERWTYLDRQGKLVPDAAFVLFPLREDLVLFDGYLAQARKVLSAGDFSDASFEKAVRIMDRAWDVLRGRLMKLDGGMLAAAVVPRLVCDVPPLPVLYYFQDVEPVYNSVVQNKVNDGVSTIPWAAVRRMSTLSSSTTDVLRALRLARRALALVQAAGEADYACRDQEELVRLLPLWIADIEKELQRRMTPRVR